MKNLIIAVILISLVIGTGALVYFININSETAMLKENGKTDEARVLLEKSNENEKDLWDILVAQKVDNKQIFERKDVKRAMPYGQVSSLSVGVINPYLQCTWGAARNSYPPQEDAPYGHQYLANCYTTYEGNAYYDGKLIDGADGGTFEIVLGDERFARDKNRIYYSGEFIGAEVIDADTFVALDERYTKDKNFVYYINKNIEEGSRLALLEIVERADPNTFEIAGRYAKDKNRIFLFNKSLQGTDLVTFQEMGERNFKDKNHAYLFSGKIIEGVDLFTLEDVSGGMGFYIKDRSHVFFSGEIVDGADPATFELIGKKNIWVGAYAKDDRYIYFGLKMMDGADRETFIVEELSNIYAKDKNHSYFEDKIIK